MPFNVNWELIWDILMLIVLKPFLTNDLCSQFHQYLSEYFESVNEINFLETRHPGLQFEHKNEIIPVRIESNIIFRSWLYMLLQQL